MTDDAAAPQAGDARRVWLGLALSGVAGFVDAVGVLLLGGMFVAFMSGNTTRLGITAFALSPEAIPVAVVILAFVGGAMAGTLLSAAAGRRPALPVLLLVEAALLALAAAMRDAAPPPLFGAALAFAMGLQNLARHTVAEAQLGTTFVTGTLVGFGQALAGMLLGRAGRPAAMQAATWAVLLAGVLAGVAALERLGSGTAMAVPCVALLILAVVAMRLAPPAR